MKVSKCWKLVEFQKTLIKMKNCKTFYETQKASPLKEIIQPPSTPHTTRENLDTSLQQNFLREIYRNIQTFVLKELQESNSWASGNGAVQMFFLTPNRNMFAGKFLKWESFLAVFWEHIIFSFERVEIRKMSEAFWAKM